MESIARKHVGDADLVTVLSKGTKLRALCRVKSWEELFSCQRGFGGVDDLFHDKILIIWRNNFYKFKPDVNSHRTESPKNRNRLRITTEELFDICYSAAIALYYAWILKIKTKYIKIIYFCHI